MDVEVLTRHFIRGAELLDGCGHIPISVLHPTIITVS